MDDLVQYLWFKDYIMPAIIHGVILLLAVLCLCIGHIGKIITRKRRRNND